MVAPSVPRDARSKIPPGPEGSNGIDRRGRRGQPAGPPPFRLHAFPRTAGCSVNGPVATGRPPRRRIRQPGAAATVSIDAGAEVNRRGPPPFRLHAFLRTAGCSVNGPVATGRPLRRRICRPGAAATVSIDAGAEVNRRGHRLFGFMLSCLAPSVGPRAFPPVVVPAKAGIQRLPATWLKSPGPRLRGDDGRFGTKLRVSASQVMPCSELPAGH